MYYKKLIEKYKENYCNKTFYTKNVAYAFSEKQLREAMKKLGARDISELTTIYDRRRFMFENKSR